MAIDRGRELREREGWPPLPSREPAEPANDREPERRRESVWEEIQRAWAEQRARGHDRDFERER